MLKQKHVVLIAFAIALAAAQATAKESPTSTASTAVGTPSAGASAPARPIWFKPKTEQIEVVGEVVDTWCYAGRVVGLGRGPAHEKCAKTCIMGGVTAGILDDAGTLYIAAKTKAYQGANRALLPFVAKKVRVKGWIARAGGTNILRIDSVEEWKPNKGKQVSGTDTRKA